MKATMPTEVERTELYNNFSKNKPKTLSGAIRHALTALERFEKRDDAEVDMGDWHYIKNYDGRGLVCVACLAGSALIDLCGATGFETISEKARKRLGVYSYATAPGVCNLGCNVPLEVDHYGRALESIRNKCIEQALYHWNLKDNLTGKQLDSIKQFERGLTTAPFYAADPEAFKSFLGNIVDELESLGL